MTDSNFEPSQAASKDSAGRPQRHESVGPALVIRSGFGGFLMGLANLVPGISGGTMLLAAGIYPAFIEALANVTRFRFRLKSLVVLGCVGAAAAIGILLLAGTLKELVVNQRWVMCSLFIGLTLGGVPLVWRLAQPASLSLWIAGAISFLLMVGLAVLEWNEVIGGGGSNFLMLGFAGLAGASAMILPGLSGSYLLLLMGQYVPILEAVDEFKEALSARDLTAAMDPALTVLLPVGIGVVVGVVAVGNLLEWTLRRYRAITLGVLLGLLIGSVVGLYPFRAPVPPKVGDVIHQQLVTAETIAEIKPKHWRKELFQPTPTQIASSLGLIGLGLVITLGVARLGKQSEVETGAPVS